MCSFCIKSSCKTAYGHDLWLSLEPSVKDVIEQAGDVSKYSEIVFCGYGEPTMRLNELIDIGKYFKDLGKEVRLNTNGHGNVINGKNIVPLMRDSLTQVSISLNAADSATYSKICRPQFEFDVYDKVLEFAKLCKPHFKTTLSVLDNLKSEDIEKCRSIVKELGVDFLLRQFIFEN